MKIALVGGTGDMGHGFAVRWATNHQILLGSRKEDKAVSAAKEIIEGMKKRGVDAEIWGMDNCQAIKGSDVVVLCVPFGNMESVTSDLRECYTHQTVVSPIVPMACGKHFGLTPPDAGSAAQLVQDLLPHGVKVVSAFHNVPASALKDTIRELKADIAICGDDSQAKQLVFELAREIPHLRPLDAGPLAASVLVEGLTPLLLNIARLNKLRNLSIQFVQE